IGGPLKAINWLISLRAIGGSFETINRLIGLRLIGRAFKAISRLISVLITSKLFLWSILVHHSKYFSFCMIFQVTLVVVIECWLYQLIPFYKLKPCRNQLTVSVWLYKLSHRHDNSVPAGF